MEDTTMLMFINVAVRGDAGLFAVRALLTIIEFLVVEFALWGVLFRQCAFSKLQKTGIWIAGIVQFAGLLSLLGDVSSGFATFLQFTSSVVVMSVLALLAYMRIWDNLQYMLEVGQVHRRAKIVFGMSVFAMIIGALSFLETKLFGDWIILISYFCLLYVLQAMRRAESLVLIDRILKATLLGVFVELLLIIIFSASKGLSTAVDAYDSGDLSSNPASIRRLMFTVMFARFIRKMAMVCLTGVSPSEVDWCCKEEQPRTATFDFTRETSASDSPFLSPVLKNGRGFVQIVA
eukprot:TRINITY_DN3040_c0_g1_i1.p1 TRINITY_DN3040_c0_g1~~TRINITY_DN3040_c0_g1_i1.p1  ORF type:complete len:300 (-),score=84.69 TRINITY_DN3040_c0_g1_i1:897-1769(-)